MQNTSNDLTSDVVTAFVAASPERKEAALLLLRGEAEITTTLPSPEPTGPEPYLTLKECAKRLGVSSCSLWRWGVPGHELGGRRRFRVSEVVGYLEGDDFKAKREELRAERRKA